jgi:hypothetical protein
MQYVLIENQFLSAHSKWRLKKYLNDIGFKGHQIISLPGTPTCLGAAGVRKYNV